MNYLDITDPDLREAYHQGGMKAMEAVMVMAENGNKCRLEMIKGICQKHNAPHVYEEILFMWNYQSPESRAEEKDFLDKVNSLLEEMATGGAA